MVSQHLSRIHPKTVLNILHPKMLWGIFIKEIVFLGRFRKLLKKIGWDDLDIKTGGFAANGSLLYYLTKIYHDVKPERVLELGSGQSSKLAYRYVQEKNPAEVITLEDNRTWHNKTKDSFNNEHFKYLHCPLEKISVDGQSHLWYGLSDEELTLLSDINLIIIDGPFGTKNYSRVGIVKHLPEILNREDFVIIVDDASRKGEEDTITLIEEFFQDNSINFHRFDIYGYKKQTFLVSDNHTDLFTGNH